MGKKDTGKHKPYFYDVSMTCSFIKHETVTIQYQELTDGWPLRILWKKMISCNCNSKCNSENPDTPPTYCPALKRQIVKTI